MILKAAIYKILSSKIVKVEINHFSNYSMFNKKHEKSRFNEFISFKTLLTCQNLKDLKLNLI